MVGLSGWNWEGFQHPPEVGVYFDFHDVEGEPEGPPNDVG